MVSDNKKRKQKTKAKVFETVDALKILYALINTVGGRSQAVTVPAEMIENMPPDWMDRLAFREVPEIKSYQAYLKPREDEEEKGVIITPKQKRIIV
jgi:hypothetical protein